MPLSLPPAVVRPVVRVTLGLPGLVGMSTAAERRWFDLLALGVRLPKGTNVEAVELGGVPADRVSGPWAKPGRNVLYLHGGGYAVGSPKTFRGFVTALSVASRATLYVPDYPLAPEHPFPAASDSAIAAYRALVDRGGPPILAGDSAGGNLSLATAIRVRDAGEMPALGLVLFCPWLDLSHSGASHRGAPREPVLHAKRSARNARAYASGRDLRDPAVSPLFADLAGLPPIHLQGAADDYLRSDSDRLAEAVEAAGGIVDYHRFEGVWHDFQVLGELLAEARIAVAEAGEAMDRLFSASVAAGGAVEAAAQG
jgi:epsilon-lactone hydrolase